MGCRSSWTTPSRRPVNCRPFEWGADIVTHSTTKYMDGHGAVLGGAIVDSGKFDWMAHAEKFPGLCTPDDSYHGITYAERFGKEGAFITKATAQLMRDFGSMQSPMNAYMLNLGLESLHVRMQRHCDNGMAVAKFLEAAPQGGVCELLRSGVQPLPCAGRKVPAQRQLRRGVLRPGRRTRSRQHLYEVPDVWPPSRPMWPTPAPAA